MTLKRFMAMNIFDVSEAWFFSTRFQLYQFPTCVKSTKLVLSGVPYGRMTDMKPYVYLSDGGHTENLRLYEIERRRCQFILVVDAGCGKHFAFEHLGNAVHKVSLDPREVASKQHDAAGDGTTTATVLASSIAREGAKAAAAGLNPLDLKRGIDLAVEAIVVDLKKNSKKVSSNEEIAQIGKISANGDHWTLRPAAG